MWKSINKPFKQIIKCIIGIATESEIVAHKSADTKQPLAKTISHNLHASAAKSIKTVWRFAFNIQHQASSNQYMPSKKLVATAKQRTPLMILCFCYFYTLKIRHSTSTFTSTNISSSTSTFTSTIHTDIDIDSSFSASCAFPQTNKGYRGQKVTIDFSADAVCIYRLPFTVYRCRLLFAANAAIRKINTCNAKVVWCHISYTMQNTI